MQIVINKVENGYICTLNGKMWVMKNLEEVAIFMSRSFEDSIIPVILEDMIKQNRKQDESITSDSEHV